MCYTHVGNHPFTFGSSIKCCTVCFVHLYICYTIYSSFSFFFSFFYNGLFENLNSSDEKFKTYNVLLLILLFFILLIAIFFLSFVLIAIFLKEQKGHESEKQVTENLTNSLRRYLGGLYLNTFFVSAEWLKIFACKFSINVFLVLN